MTRALRRVTTNEPEFVYVAESTAVRDLNATNAIAGYLQPGRWYHVRGEAGAWAHVTDPSGPLEGWAPVAELNRRVEVPDEVVPEPETPLREPAWEATHIVPSQGLRSWSSPDGGSAPIANLAGGVELQVTEWQSDWAGVRAENGWVAWVDGRQLVPIHTEATRPPNSPARVPTGAATPEDTTGVAAASGANRVSLIAAIALLVSAFLPWWGEDARGSFDTSLFHVWNDSYETGALTIGLLTLVVALAALATIFVAEAARHRRLVGGIAAGIATTWLLMTFAYLFIDAEELGTAVADLFTAYFALGPWMALAAGITLLVRR